MKRTGLYKTIKVFQLLLPVYMPLLTVSIQYAFTQDYKSAAESTNIWNSAVSVVIKDTTDGALFILGEITIPESKENVWKIVTDYGNLKSFIPGMSESSILANEGDSKLIKQKGLSRFLFFRKSITVTLQVEEYKPDSIIFQLKEGPFHTYRGGWRLIEESHGELILRYQAIVKPAFFSPKFLVRRILRNEFRLSLEAIRNEAKRRFVR